MATLIRRSAPGTPVSLLRQAKPGRGKAAYRSIIAPSETGSIDLARAFTVIQSLEREHTSARMGRKLGREVAISLRATTGRKTRTTARKKK